jgi:hypothetical protein
MQVINISLKNFFLNNPCGKCCVETVIYKQCGKTTVRGTMDAGINNINYVELHLGPKMVNGTCGKTIVAGTIDRGSVVDYKYVQWLTVLSLGGVYCTICFAQHD